MARKNSVATATAQKSSALSVGYRPISGLIPYARNARTHSPEQIAQIAASIREFGWTTPVLIDADGGIIAGHGRVLAAHGLGLKEVPCIELAHLTEAQRRAYTIADNKLTLNAGWDLELLKLELQDLSDLEFDLALVGFDAAEIGTMFKTVEAPEDFPEKDETIETAYRCPKCAYEWSGKPK